MPATTVVSIAGFSGSLQSTLSHAWDLAKELLQSGYDVSVNGRPVRLEHGPGYDTVVYVAEIQSVI